MEYKQSQVETLIFDCNPTGDGTTAVSEFTKTLNITMDSPKGVLVKQISYVAKLNESTITVDQEDKSTVTYPIEGSSIKTIVSSLINNKPFGTISSGSTSSPNTYFALGSVIKGDYTFRINSYPSSVTALGILALTLEFIK